MKTALGSSQLSANISDSHLDGSLSNLRFLTFETRVYEPSMLQELARDSLIQKAFELGFARIGFAAAGPPSSYPHLLKWIDNGFAGEMSYIAKRREAYSHPSFVLADAQSVIMLALPYPKSPRTLPSKKSGSHSNASSERTASQLAESSSPKNDDLYPSITVNAQEKPQLASGAIASYACGSVDYHDLIHEKLKLLIDHLGSMFPKQQSRGIVDTAPLLERDFARQSGMGWVGKNTMLIHPQIGSYFFLAAIITQIRFSPDEETQADRCGSCRACLDACPTQAFVEPRVLDASRCISYLTIEYRNTIPDSLADKMEDWLFGCDVCQAVCPWNRKPDVPIEAELDASIDLAIRQDCLHWLTIDEPTFRRLYRATPFWRTRLHGMQRNAILVAANTNRLDAIESIEALTSSEHEPVRHAAQWALQRLRPAQ